MSEDSSPTLRQRRAQTFPVLTAQEVARVKPFAEVQRFRDGEALFETGKPSAGVFVLLSGAIRLVRREGLSASVDIAEQGPGEFTGEVGQLSGKPSMVDGFAVGAVRTLRIDPEQLRALLVADAALGEKIMRALILRRVGMLETGAGGPVLIGPASHPDVIRLQRFLSRNSHPHRLLDPDQDAEARLIAERYVQAASDVPLVVCPDGSLLSNPAERLLAQRIGMLDTSQPIEEADVTIVGAGPAGLAAAVYAASEGLSVVVIDARGFGGQAGASARIENYLGFPTGISGQALAGRAYSQAQKFGVRMLIPEEVIAIDCDRARHDGRIALRLAGGRSVLGRTVVIATGARYRRPQCRNLKPLEGRGVWYWASPIEARTCAAQHVAVVGGGNSAGQGAVFLASQGAKVAMLIRGDDLSDSMSQYLIDRIRSTSGIELRTRTEITALIGTRKSGLQAVRWRNRDSGAEETHPIRHVFVFVGADPATEWLRECGIRTDPKGFVVTGRDLQPTDASPSRQSLETSVAGVFAIGDVRKGSVKRVGGAIGEGAAAVSQVHAFLAAEPS